MYVCMSVCTSVCLCLLTVVSVFVGAGNHCYRLSHNCLQCLLFFFNEEAASERQQCDCYLWLHHVSGCGLHFSVYLQHLSVQPGLERSRYILSTCMPCISFNHEFLGLHYEMGVSLGLAVIVYPQELMLLVLHLSGTRRPLSLLVCLSLVHLIFECLDIWQMAMAMASNHHCCEYCECCEAAQKLARCSSV